MEYVNKEIIALVFLFFIKKIISIIIIISFNQITEVFTVTTIHFCIQELVHRSL